MGSGFLKSCVFLWKPRVGSCMVFDDINQMCWCIVMFEFFGAFWFFLRKKAKYVWTKRRCISQSPFFQKRAFSFIYLAKTEGLWSRKVKTLSGTKAPPFYWEIWAQKPFFRKKGFAICIGFQSFLLRGKLCIIENCKVFLKIFRGFFFKKPAKKFPAKKIPREKNPAAANSSSSSSSRSSSSSSSSVYPLQFSHFLRRFMIF